MGMTYVQKVIAAACNRPSVAIGDVVEPEVHLAMSHENGALVMNQFNEIYKDTGLEAKVWNPDRIAIILDHRVPAESSKTATNQKKLRDFAANRGSQNSMIFAATKGVSAIRSFPSMAMSARAWSSSAPIATLPAMAHWAHSPSESAPPKWRQSGRWAHSQCRSARHHQN